MDKHPHLKETISTTNFTDVWDRYKLIFRYVMKNIKGFTVIEEQEHLTIYQINHMKMECAFLKVVDFFVVRMRVDTHTDQIKVNINDYYNGKTKTIIRLPMLIDNVSTQIDTVISRNARTNGAASSVKCSEQSNVPQQQQIPGVSTIPYYSPNYITQQATPPSMQSQRPPFNCHLPNRSGLIQATTAVDEPKNMLIPSASSTRGAATPGLSSFHYTQVYPDPHTYDSYSSATGNPPSIYSNCQLAQPYLQYQQQQQHQPTDQQRDYGNGQNISFQQTSSNGVLNNTSRSTLTSGQSSADYGGASPLLPQYTLNNVIANAYTYGTPTRWIPSPEQIPSLQTNVPPQMNAAPSVGFDPFQQIPSQQTTYMNPNTYEAPVYFPQ